MARARIAGARLTTTRNLAARARNAFAVPGGPIALASNPRDKTLYVVTLGRTISLVSTARCNRLVRSGCKVAASVPGHPGFQFVAVDPSTDTIYALFGGTTGAGHTVQVINGARCNAGNASDCHAVATVQVGRFPIGAALDRAARTLYVSNNYSGTVSMINTSEVQRPPDRAAAPGVPPWRGSARGRTSPLLTRPRTRCTCPTTARADRAGTSAAAALPSR